VLGEEAHANSSDRIRDVPLADALKKTQRSCLHEIQDVLETLRTTVVENADLGLGRIGGELQEEIHQSQTLGTSTRPLWFGHYMHIKPTPTSCFRAVRR
jgi:hypothetical protein